MGPVRDTREILFELAAAAEKAADNAPNAELKQEWLDIAGTYRALLARLPKISLPK